MARKKLRLRFESLEQRHLLSGDISLIRFFDTWDNSSIASTDPAGIAYHAPSGRLLLADSEIDELPQYFVGHNIFEISTNGETVYRRIASGNSEPTGITYNEFDGYFYVTNDDTILITRYDANLNLPLASVDPRTATPNATDPEDIASDPTTGMLYVVDGVGGGRQILVYDSNLVFQYRFSIGNQVQDGEGIAFDPESRHLFVVSSPNLAVFEYTTTGQYVQAYDLSEFVPQPITPQGLAFAPTSDPNDDPDDMALYIADGMIDNFADGRVFETEISDDSELQFLEAGISVGSNDVEERTSGSVALAGGDLVLVGGGDNLAVGLRFTNITIPHGATIEDAYVQFTVDAVTSTATSLVVSGQAIDNAPAFAAVKNNVTSRMRTSATVNWTPPAWTTVRAAGPEQRTPDLASILQEITDRPGWNSGNAMVLIITGTGAREAESYEGGTSYVPRLRIEYRPSAPPPNTPPQVNAGPDQTVPLSSVVNLDGTVTDDGVPSPFTTNWSQVSGPVTAVFGNPSDVDTTSTFPQAGIYVLRLEAFDGDLISSDEVTIQVDAPPNTPPEVNAGPDQTVPFSTVVNLDGTVTDDGVPSPFTTNWSQVSGPVTAVFGNPSDVDTTATFPQAGIYVLRLEAFDGDLISSDEVTIQVDAPPNTPPEVNAGPDQTVPFSTVVNLDGTVTDDGVPSPFTTNWSQVSGPVTAVFGNASDVDTTAMFPQAGTYVLRLEVFDGDLISNDDVTIQVDAPSNTPPEVNAGPDQTVPFSTVVNLDGTVTDDGVPSPFTTNWSQVSGPDTAVFGNPSDVDTTATFPQAGTYVLRLEAFDGDLISNDEVTIQVDAPSNTPPEVNAGPDQTVPFSTVLNLDGTVTDDGVPSPFTTNWSQVSGPGTAVFGNSSNVDTTATFLQAGTYVLRLEAFDGDLISSDEVTIQVNTVETINVRVAAASDDAEEKGSGSVKLLGGDLALVFDETNQTVGLRFTGIGIPQGATIANAYVQFQVDDATSVPTSLFVQGQAIDNAPTFTAIRYNLSTRAKTSAAVSWAPPAWPTVGAAGVDQRTPNIASVLQQIVDRPGWNSGNAMVILITGTGTREAESYDGKAIAAALLHVEFIVNGSSSSAMAAPESQLAFTATNSNAAFSSVAVSDPKSQSLPYWEPRTPEERQTVLAPVKRTIMSRQPTTTGELLAVDAVFRLFDEAFFLMDDAGTTSS